MRRLTLGALLCATALLAAAPAAQAAFGLSAFSVTYTDAEGQPVTQAGSHPFAMSTSLHFNTAPGNKLEAAAKDIIVTQPAGFIGNPTAVPRCSSADFLTPYHLSTGDIVSSCPDAAAVGTIEVQLAASEEAGSLYGAVYDLTPPPGVAAKLGFWIENFPITIELGVSETPPYNILGGPTNITQTVEVTGAVLTLWGNPGDSRHNSLRGRCLNPTSGESLGGCAAGVASPFLTMPRSCGTPLTTLYAADPWSAPGAFVTGSFTAAAMGGCEKLGFGPELTARPTTSSAESASGLDLEIEVPGIEGLSSPEGTAPADIEATEVRLPAGVTVNPSAAEGLGVCTQAQFEAASLANPGCPQASKLGSLEVETPVLERHTLRGAFYLAEPHQNPFGSLLAAYLTIKDEELGVFVKLPAKITTDPATGQIVTTVQDMPPFPLSHVAVHLRSGPRAPLITPPSCGTYTTEATLTPSSGAAPLPSPSSFQIASGPGGGPCPAALPFAPGFSAGTANNAASAYSPFAMRITRNDGEADLTRFSATLPVGVVGKIAGLEQCPDAAIEAAKARSGKEELASPSCPAASRVGSVVAGAGVGTALTYVPGSLYLAGPYKGAPLSVAAIVPAVAGPFDVGTVVTRVGLQLNPQSGRVEVDGAASDPIPHILEGIPLKLRDLRVYADRPGFTTNATGCTEKSTEATLWSDTGATANPFARYQAASCASLDFKPKLALSLKGATKRAGHPALRTVLTFPYRPGPGHANVGGGQITLPPTEFIANAHINNPCTRVQFNAGECPKSSVLGTAKAWSPLLDEPLQGPVYFRSNGGKRKLPDVVADLHGQFHFTLAIAVFAKKARITSKILNAPDAPVSRFALHLYGGKRGLLENSANLCKAKRRANVALVGQNGKRARSRPVVGTSCKKRRKKKHGRHRGR